MNHPRFKQLVELQFNNKQPFIFDTDPETNEPRFFNNKTIKSLLYGKIEEDLRQKKLYKPKYHTIDKEWFERMDKALNKIEKFGRCHAIPNKSIITKKDVAYPLVKQPKPHKINRHKKVRGKKRLYKNLEFQLAYAQKYLDGES